MLDLEIQLVYFLFLLQRFHFPFLIEYSFQILIKLFLLQ